MEGEFNVLIIQLLGPNLEKLLKSCGGKFNLYTVLMVADQTLTLIEELHTKFYIHRDIKPENLAIGIGKKSDTVYLIDFGLAKRYRDSINQQHIPYRDGKTFTGTMRYASVNAHLGLEQSRRDDLESLGFVFVYLAKGKLPWQGCCKEEDCNTEILKKMLGTSIDALCQGLPGNCIQNYRGISNIL